MKKIGVLLAIVLVLTAHAMKRTQPDIEAAEQTFLLGNMPVEVKTNVIMMFAKSQTLQEAIDALRELTAVNKEFHDVLNDTKNTKYLIALLVAKFGGYHEDIARSLATPGAQEYVKHNAALLQEWWNVKNLQDAQQLLRRARENGAIDINYQDSQGNTPLFIMVMRGNLKEKNTLVHFLGGKIASDVVALLIEKYANVNITNGTYTPLILALEGGNIAMAKNILEGTTQKFINFRQKQGQRQTALMVALDIDNVEIIAKLLERGADVSIKDNDGMTVINYARANVQISLESDEEEDSEEIETRERILELLGRAEKEQAVNKASQQAKKE